MSAPNWYAPNSGSTEIWDNAETVALQHREHSSRDILPIEFLFEECSLSVGTPFGGLLACFGLVPPETLHHRAMDPLCPLLGRQLSPFLLMTFGRSAFLAPLDN